MICLWKGSKFRPASADLPERLWRITACGMLRGPELYETTTQDMSAVDCEECRAAMGIKAPEPGQMGLWR